MILGGRHGGNRRQISVLLSESPDDDSAACLMMILGSHGCEVTLDGLRDELGNDGHDGSALGLVRAAERRGLKARGVLMSRADDFLELHLPSVLHWTDEPGRLTGKLDPSRSVGRFVVIERASQLGLLLIDPLRGRLGVTLDQAAAHTTGVVVMFGDVERKAERAPSPGDWMNFYYATPEPERFVPEVRELAEQGILADPQHAFPIVVFLSFVIADNGHRVPAWFDALHDLDPAALGALQDAAWLSRSTEAHAYLTAKGLTPPTDADPLDVLDMNVEELGVLDGLWAIYFATGDPRAVRKIVSALDYMTDLGAAKAFSASAKTEAGTARAWRDAIYQAASWSLVSLMRQHAPLKDFCADLVRSGEITPNERLALGMILAELEPTHWSVRFDPKTSMVEVAWKDPQQSPPRNKPWWKLW